MRRRSTLVRTLTGATVAATALTGALVAGAGPAGAQLAAAGDAAASGAVAGADASAAAAGGSTFVVMFAQGTDGAAAVSAARAAGGTVVSVDRKLGYAVVRAADAGFAGKVSKASGVQGAARDRVIGEAPKERRDDVERPAGAANAAAPAAATPAPAEPLANRQWDMRQIGATPQGSYAVNQGSKKVMVGVIDTGVDGTHPDIAPNFDAKALGQLRHRQPRDRRAVRVRDLQRPGQRGRRRPRHARRQHDRLADQRPRHRRASRRTSRSSTSAPGQDSGYFFLAADGRGARVRRRHRRRRRQHELLHRPVALQLPREPGRLARGADRAARGPRAHPARCQLRASTTA